MTATDTGSNPAADPLSPRAGRFARALACLAVVGCQLEPEGILVTVVSDLNVPTELNKLAVRVSEDRHRILLDHEVQLSAAEDGSMSGLLGTFGLRLSSPSHGPLTIDVIGMLFNRALLKQTLVQKVPERGVWSTDVSLGRACRQQFCPQGQTCLLGMCVDQQTRLPWSQVASPTCDCGSYFPFCLHARWNYDLHQDATGARPTGKTWYIADHQTVTDATCEMDAVPAYLMVVQGINDTSGKWLNVDQRDGKQRIWWLKEDWVDAELDPASTICYQPRKLRVDEGRTAFEETWTERYTRSEFELGSPDPQIEEHEDRWQVVTVDQVIQAARPRVSRFPIRYRDSDVLCHYREDRTGNRLEKKYYCFARNIGKIYEFDAGANEQEVLREDYHVPGCPIRPQDRR
jgi:hypothetical protein